MQPELLPLIERDCIAGSEHHWVSHQLILHMHVVMPPRKESDLVARPADGLTRSSYKIPSLGFGFQTVDVALCFPELDRP